MEEARRRFKLFQFGYSEANCQMDLRPFELASQAEHHPLCPPERSASPLLAFASNGARACCQSTLRQERSPRSRLVGAVAVSFSFPRPAPGLFGLAVGGVPACYLCFVSVWLRPGPRPAAMEPCHLVPPDAPAREAADVACMLFLPLDAAGQRPFWLDAAVAPRLLFDTVCEAI